MRSVGRAGRTGEEGDKKSDCKLEAHPSTEVGDTNAIGMTLGPVVPVEVVWIDCASSNGLPGDGLPEVGRVVAAGERLGFGSMSMTLSTDEE